MQLGSVKGHRNDIVSVSPRNLVPAPMGHIEVVRSLCRCLGTCMHKFGTDG